MIILAFWKNTIGNHHHAGLTSPINVCWCSWTPLSTEQGFYKCTFTLQKMCWLKSTLKQESRELTRDLLVWWVSLSCIWNSVFYSSTCFSFTVQLLHKMSIKAANGPMKLLKVIKNPIQDHLPVGCRKISTTFSSTKLVKPRDVVLPEEPIAIVIGAMAHGKVDVEYSEEEISISQYPLSAALTCSKLCSAFEEVWGIHWQLTTFCFSNQNLFFFFHLKNHSNNIDNT